MRQWALGIDPSLSRTGVFAIGIGGPGEKDSLLWEEFSSQPRQTAGIRDRFYRYSDLVSRVRDWIEATCGKLDAGNVAENGRCGQASRLPSGPRIACIEGYAYGSKYAARACMELGSAFRSMLLQTCHEVVEAAPSQLKKMATEHGGASKAEVKERCEGEFGIDLPNDDVSDACACAWAAAIVGGLIGSGFDTQDEIAKKIAETV